MKRRGRKSAAQTPAPAKERVYGSKKNPSGSAASKSSASKIQLSDSIVETLKNKAKKYNESHKKDVSESTLKAVMRRGMGAYSKSHRPTITGGAPNSRQAWGFARVNKFLKKKSGQKVKEAYVQDDDLLAFGGKLKSKSDIGQVNFGEPDKLFYSFALIHETEKDNIDSILNSGFRKPTNENITLGIYTIPEKWKSSSFGATSSRSGGELEIKLKEGAKIFWSNSDRPMDFYSGRGNKYFVKLFTQLSNKKPQWLSFEDRIKFLRKFEKWLSQNGYCGVQQGGEIVITDLSCIETIKKYKRNKKVDGGMTKKTIIATPITYQIDDYNLEFAKNYLTEWQKDRWIKKGRSKEEIDNDIEIAKKEIKLITERTPFTTWFLDLPKGKYNFSVVDAEYEIKKDVRKVRVEIGWRAVTQNKTFWSVIKTNEVSSPFDFFIENNFEYDSKEKVINHINNKFKQLIYDTNVTKFPLPNNPDIRYKDGGMAENLPVGKLAKGMSLSEVAAKHGLSADALKSELMLGIETEKEHTDNPEIARAIALDHLFEDPKYYTKLKQIEGMDLHLSEISAKYANGGSITPIFQFNTPTGEKSSLTYLQQVLVRTKAFKTFFGDWEAAAKRFLADNRQNFAKHFADVSLVLDYTTFEPKAVYHGTRSENEFFRFDVNKDKGMGRPYGYFAHNKQYSQNFTTSSQRSARSSKPYLYEVFLDVRKPFYANTDSFVLKNKDANSWRATIASAIAIQKYAPNKPTSDETMEIDLAVESQIGKYIESVYRNGNAPFWKLMAADVDKDFKYFLMSYGFDGIFYSEEFQSSFDPDDPAQFTRAVTIFDSKQVKLADGRNLNFDALIDDIRYDEGGDIEAEPVEEKSLHMNKKMKLGALLFGDTYAEGGEVIDADGNKTNDGKKGGYFKGRSHAEGGIKAVNKDTGQLIEVEGNEVIITKGAVADDTLREFEGEMLTNKQILSKINQSGGGVSFEEGGELKEGGHTCGCSGKKYNYGGQLMEDYNILRSLNDPYDATKVAVNKARSLVDDLISKMK